MILTIGHTKGGVGKTTLAVNLTILRAKTHAVLLVDGDEQSSSLTFTSLRGQQRSPLDYTAVALTGAAIRQQVPKLAPNYQDIIIDAGGRDSAGFRAALTVSDLLLIPLPPRSLDLWALDTVAELVAQAQSFRPQLRALVVLSLADSQGQENAAARALLEEYPFTILPSMIVRRKAYADAISHGLGVGELKPINSKALAEVTQLTASVWSEG